MAALELDALSSWKYERGCCVWCGVAENLWGRAATSGHYFSRLILFQPKSRASRDRAPGPTSASAAPIAANKMPARGSSCCTSIPHAESTMTRGPAIGVHKPATRSAPSTIANRTAIGDPTGWPARYFSIPSMMRNPPQTTRSNNRPTPGQPLKKLEKRRRMNTLFRRLPIGRCPTNPPKESVSDYLECLELYDSALQAYRGGMGPIVGIQLGKDVFDAALYRFFSD
jgi:hypothetical protein